MGSTPFGDQISIANVSFLLVMLFLNLILLVKLKEEYDGLMERHSKLEVQVKTSEMEIENQAKRCALLEGEIKGKVCYSCFIFQKVKLLACKGAAKHSNIFA